jgi:Ca2+-binding EF-hand superfamily protein
MSSLLEPSTHQTTTMKPTIQFLCAFALIGTALAQPPENERRGQGGPGGGMARQPIFKALDKDENGELSAEEIAAAPVALLTLDKNGDGKLSTEEVRPVMQPRGDTPAQTAHRIFESFDKNTDGKITADELPERMKAMIEKNDANKDGAVTEEELATQIQKDSPPPAPPGERGPRPEGGPPAPAPTKPDA